MGRVICFANNKGGVGKTTTCVAIGQAWAAKGKKILFVDLDCQGNLTYMIQNKEVAKNREKTIRQAIICNDISVIERVGENIDLIPSDLSFANFERDTATMNGREYLLLDLLKPKKEDYDYILIDCPPALGLITYNALIASDYFIAVSTPDGLSYQGLQWVIKHYAEVSSSPRLNPDLKFAGVIITRNENSRVNKDYIKHMMQEIPEYILNPIISKSARVAEAGTTAASIYDIDPKGKCSLQYQELAINLAEKLTNMENY